MSGLLRRGIRPSTTQGTVALWAKSLLNAILFFALFMVAIPWVADWCLPAKVPIPSWLGETAGVMVFVVGLAVWGRCLDAFSRRGRGTPFALDAPRQLVTTGPHGVVRNPIMVGELAVIWGEALYTSSLGVLIYAAAMTLAGHLAVVYVEEPELRQRFGEEYATYCYRVARWTPWRALRSQ